MRRKIIQVNNTDFAVKTYYEKGTEITPLVHIPFNPEYLGREGYYMVAMNGGEVIECRHYRTSTLNLKYRHNFKLFLNGWSLLLSINVNDRGYMEMAVYPNRKLDFGEDPVLMFAYPEHVAQSCVINYNEPKLDPWTGFPMKLKLPDIKPLPIDWEQMARLYGYGGAGGPILRSYEQGEEIQLIRLDSDAK